jgi:glycosyltransferase involved in cell wall biosynthesis
MSEPLVTIITATTGSRFLEYTLKSVAEQSYKNIQHLVVVDGKHRQGDAMKAVYKYGNSKTESIVLPYSVGEGGYNGHLIYGACTYLMKGEWVIYLDDDNTLERDHVASLVNAVTKRPNVWAYSLRNIIDADSNFVCQDNCESLGQWHTVINSNDFFVDVNCYMLPRNIAIEMTPVWNRKFRTLGIMEIDRAIYHFLSNRYPDFDSTYKYSVNYRAGNTPNSVQKEFFINGNQVMSNHLGGKLPWVKEIK